MLIDCENHEKIKIIKIQFEIIENHENHIIPYENKENHEILELHSRITKI